MEGAEENELRNTGTLEHTESKRFALAVVVVGKLATFSEAFLIANSNQIT
jgi:hypothetical protein